MILIFLLLLSIPFVEVAGASPITSCPKKTLALTFDDGPSAHTMGILDVLRKHKVKASFFVLGSSLESPISKSVLTRLVDEGHLICSHGYSHGDMTAMTSAQVTQELKTFFKVLPGYIGGQKSL